ncbi:ATP-binding protein [Halomicrobium urmianum]|uniref:ATP-binding protein n=1 Tax=Halomicrobium urmianum TaxID=1586233 RepID=UPI001CD9D15C|nr:hypothetical protein [Halomicrobium urmianum]
MRFGRDSPANDPDESLPTPETTTYLTITPADDPLDPGTISTGFQRLHQLDHPADQSLLDRLTPGSPTPTIEVLLVADPTDETTVEYAVTIDPPELLAPLERTLRDCLPTSYELTETDVHPAVDLLHTDTDATPDYSAVEFHGRPDHPKDWQTRLTPFTTFYEDASTETVDTTTNRGSTTADDHRVPLSGLVEILAQADTPAVVQLLLEPMADWTAQAEERRHALEHGTDATSDAIVSALVGQAEEYEPPAPDRQRFEELAAKNARRSFVVNARALVHDSPTTTTLAHDLGTAFGHVGHTTYDVVATEPDDPTRILEAIRDRTVHQPDYDGLTARLPGMNTTSRGIVADATEVGSFCLVDGTALTAAGQRALDPIPGERQATPAPPADVLTTYQDSSLPLGRPQTQNATARDEPVTLPPELQPLHLAWFGKTGSGKSTSLLTAILHNYAATDGADILIDPKGDGMATDYLRAHYERYGHLENVLYFDCAEVIPAISVFDIRDELAAGVDRTTAVEDTVDHYLEMLTQIMGQERFDQAVRSPDVIRYLVKALFDPVSGDDAFAHSELHSSVRQMHERESAPTVSNDDLERMLAGVVANDARAFDQIMQGVANRIEKIPADRRLAALFNHVPEGLDDPQFDFADYLDEDVVVIVDTGGLRSHAQRVLTLVLLSNLWTALRRRDQNNTESEAQDDDAENESVPDTDNDHALVNVYLEEAASVAVTNLLQELLAQSRSFGCSMTLAMQFPGQLRSQSERVYQEVLNNVSTIVTGNVAVDRELARRLATDDYDPDAVGNRLRALSRGEWLVSLPAGFGDREPRPFRVESLPLPPGHPDREGTADADPTFERTRRDLEARTRAEAGLTLDSPSTTEASSAETDQALETPSGHIDSALPYTNRLPEPVEYDAEVHALVCELCGNRYASTSRGMRRVIECCHTLKAVDRDDVPICEVPLKLSADERAASDWTDRQLLFLQAVYNAQQLRYDPLEYDLLRDSMLRLQEYVGIDSEAVQELIDADLLRHDADHPHRLYTVTPDGRSAIGESYRRGIDYGHGVGDLEESSQHVMAVEAGRQHLEAEYVADEDSDVVEVVPYYEPDDEQTTVPASLAMGTGEEADSLAEVAEQTEQRRLDIVGLDADGEITVTVEVERVNNDYHRAVPEDYDKLAACEPEEAIWIVMTQSAGHDVLGALNDPIEGEPRVEKTYSNTTPPQDFRIDTPGLTAMYPIRYLLNQIDEDE